MMMKIRYLDLPSGLHVSATKHGRRTIIYLKPGLTPAERHAAFTRVRSSGRMGHGPELHPFGMAVAISADWIRATTRNGLAALRSHPVLLLPPLILLVSTAIVFILMSFVTLTMAPRQPEAGTIGPGGLTPSQALSRSGSTAAPPGGRRSGAPGSNDGPGGRPPAGETPSPGPSTINSPTPDPSDSDGQDPTPSPVTSGSPSPDPGSPSPSPSPSASPSSSSSSGTCVQIGPLGLCVTL
jgi:hypothetical protein